MLNRTAGPPDSDITSFEVMSGDQPSKIKGILPFGCRAHVVRPKEFVVKSRIDAYTWVGAANLGRSSSSPGAYNIWVPSTGRVHRSSDIYFTERFFSLTGQRATSMSAPTCPPRPRSTRRSLLRPGIPIAVHTLPPRRRQTPPGETACALRPPPGRGGHAPVRPRAAFRPAPRRQRAARAAAASQDHHVS